MLHFKKKKNVKLDFFDTIFLKILENSAGIVVVKLKQRKKTVLQFQTLVNLDMVVEAFGNPKKEKKEKKM